MINPFSGPPVHIEGTYVRLEPLQPSHWEALCSVGLYPALWKHSINPLVSPADMRRYIETALAEQAAAVSVPFVIRHLQHDRLVGCTRFGSISRPHRRVEIGWTWITPDFQRTVVNSEIKYLMLAYAFESENCIRVELKTDVLNTQSRTAIKRLGAQEEGILRNHMIRTDGSIRDTVYYSIVVSEWPSVKSALKQRMNAI